MKYIMLFLAGAVVVLILLTVIEAQDPPANRQQASASTTCIGLLNIGCDNKIDQRQQPPEPQSGEDDPLLWVGVGGIMLGLLWLAFRPGGHDAQAS